MNTFVFLALVAAIGGFWFGVGKFVSRDGARPLMGGAVGAIGMIVSFAALFSLGRAPETTTPSRQGMVICTDVQGVVCKPAVT